MKFLVVLAACIFAASAVTDKDQWLLFKQNHGKAYKNLREEQQRFSIFQDNLRTIEAHNELHKKGEKTYTMGVNQFTDMTAEEFKSMLTYSTKGKPVNDKPITWHMPSGVAAPESVNWVAQGVVTGVKNQGQCGSCWAFSATGSVEGLFALRYGQLVSLSEQNLMDCSTANGGCNGGVMQYAFDYIRDNGIETEGDYPYQEAQGACRFDSSLSVTRVSGYVNVPHDEGSLLDAVANVGPISIAINADYFQHYSGGVFNEPSCDPNSLDHGVLAAGYGNQDGWDYWLVKNSWGESWGENGYVKMVRNNNNQCGIANDGTYPLL